MATQNPVLVDAKTVGDAIGLGPSTVLRLANTSRIPSVRVNRRVVRFNLDEVMARLKETKSGR
jgi:hypothetical protein